MESQLYFWKPMMLNYQNELGLVEIYYRKSLPTFEFTEQDIRNEVEKTFASYQFPEGVDLSDIGESMTEAEVNLYETFQTMKSNHLLITISMLAHMWEQQIVRFVHKELQETFRDVPPLSYDKALRVIETHGVEVRTRTSWEKIIRHLVNTIKHGEGRSAKKLRKLRPDFFATEGFLEDEILDILELNGAVLLDPYSLNVEESDLFDYIQATKDFWEEMPERAFCNLNTGRSWISED